MPSCPKGHQSATDDWCEVCGHRMSSAPRPSPAPERHAALSAAEPCPYCGAPRDGLAQFCEGCRYNFVTRSGMVSAPKSPPSQSRPSQSPLSQSPPSQSPPSQSPQSPQSPLSPSQPSQAPTGAGVPAAAPTWTVTVSADRGYFTEMMANGGPEGLGFSFPGYFADLHVPLTQVLVTIGRRRQSTGETPDIDLAGSPEDPGVSHEHAMLIQQPDSTWSLIDKGSTNGTTVNGTEDPITPYVPVQLKDGDRVHVGLWTTITIRQD
ncbi:FHA domain-containing protein [Streptomyces sp. NBC_00878]|uniref:FHA domain-containing protein n=1 Tax=Streptomyces sp. NBC_00878 TaxID=2975854 RepID=UPI00225C3957|nr:FHA domain-containing protein [Streptomyces sp. NBC_00878]MCX4904368.1 FHA domain-containing protein [Streptomyces sp. NBC_00878]